MSWTDTKQVLAIDVKRERLDLFHTDATPYVNLFMTRSAQKAMMWSRLESLDLIIMRFGEPIEPTIDLLQGVIEANPAVPVLLLVEPDAELVAHRLVRQEICLQLPASVAPELFRDQVWRLLEPATGRRAVRRPAPPIPVTVPASTPELPEASITRRALGDGPALTPVEGAGTPPASAAERMARMPMPATPASLVETPFLDQLIIELAHRLKNPLVSIKTFTHLLRERFDDAEFRSRFYTIVNRDVTQLDEVIEQLVEFSEFSQPLLKPLLVMDEVNAAKEAVEPAFRSKPVVFRIDPVPSTVQVHADPLQFRYLLKQLLMESGQAAPSGGQVRIRVASERPLLHHEGSEAPSVSVSIETAVESNGRHRDWLNFELLLARSLVERHHGSLSIEAGTRVAGAGRRVVTISFPLREMARSARIDSPVAGISDAPVSTRDRRRIPLMIAFRERRQKARRLQSAAIAFKDRRRQEPQAESGVPSRSDTPKN